MTTLTQELPDEDQTRVIERPDGFYWQDKLTDKLYGPFATRLEALMDKQVQDQNGNGFGVGESLADAEAEIGIADWTDPETGQPAEGSPPHLNDD